jgi:glutamine cyclotransferase
MMMGIALTGSCDRSAESQPGQPPLPVDARCPYPIPALKVELQSAIQRSALGFTEGLLFSQGTLYESTGSYQNVSMINAISPSTGQVTPLTTTPSNTFGEGLAELGSTFFQLTYHEGKMFKYTSEYASEYAFGRKSLQLYESDELPLSQGWGLTSDGNSLIASEGSSNLYSLDPSDLFITRRVSAHDRFQKTYSGLNELEYVQGSVYANVFPTSKLLRIELATGCVTGQADLSFLSQSLSEKEKAQVGNDPENVLNGIAYNPEQNIYYLAGKNWPKLFRAKIME